MGKGSSNIDSKALNKSASKINNTKQSWKDNVADLNNVVKSLESNSKNHDDCFSGDIKKLKSLSSQLSDIEKGGHILYSKIISVVEAYRKAVKHRVVNIARKELSPNNKSRVGGKKYWTMFKKYRKYNTVEWCACYVSWVMKKAGVPKDIITRSGKVNDFYNDSVKNNTFRGVQTNYQPKKGDIIIWQEDHNPTGRSHVGIVEKTKKDKVIIIEGNAGSSDSRLSKVCRNTYTKSSGYGGCTGFISPKYNKNKDKNK